MSETFTIFFIFMGVMAVTAVVFVVWLILAAVRLVGRGLMGIVGYNPRDHAANAAYYHCPRRGCNAINPAAARFCRRCGRELLRTDLTRRCSMC